MKTKALYFSVFALEAGHPVGQALDILLDVAIPAVTLVVSGHQLVREVLAETGGDHVAELLFEPGLVCEVAQSQVQMGLEAGNGVEHFLGARAYADVTLGGEVHGLAG